MTYISLSLESYGGNSSGPTSLHPGYIPSEYNTDGLQIIGVHGVYKDAPATRVGASARGSRSQGIALVLDMRAVLSCCASAAASSSGRRRLVGATPVADPRVCASRAAGCSSVISQLGISYSTLIELNY